MKALSFLICFFNKNKIISRILIKVEKILLVSAILFMFAENLFSAALDVNIRNFSDNTITNNIEFGTIAATQDYKLADQYLEVIFISSKPAWQIDIYTDNFDLINTTHPVTGEKFISTATWGYQYNGLINSSCKGCRMPLGWKVFDSTPVSPSPNDPSTEDSWFYIKDKSDVDDPGPEAPGDQSWEYAQKGRYTSFVYGGVDYACLEDGSDCTMPAYLCIEAVAKYAAGGFAYSGTIWLDLFIQTDVSPPVISHTPKKKIGMLGNNIKMEATITDDKLVAGAILSYKINSGKWKEKAMVMHGNLPYNKYCYAVIEPREITGESKIRYYIKATDGINPALWNNKNEDNPQVIEITQSTKFSKVKSGKLVVEDGNPDDGEVSLYIPEGALDEPEDITIIQRNIDDPDIPGGNGAAASKIPVAVYEFKPHRLLFNKQVTMTLLYFDLNQDGKVEYQNGKKTDIEETELGLFWWDGFDWRLIGGNADEEKNIVTGKITHFSLYAVFPVKPLTADDYRPKERIITPATMDMINDFATYDGLYNEYEINIYDITGRLVKTIDENSIIGAKWDGKDEYGNIVESGVYIYQFSAKVDGRMILISGVIAVAK